MDEYIEREAVLKIIADNCPHDKGGYNTEEEMGAGSACYYIRRAVETVPTAEVVPKSEVEKIIEETFKRVRENFVISPLCKSALSDLEVELKKKYTEEKT